MLNTIKFQNVKDNKNFPYQKKHMNDLPQDIITSEILARLDYPDIMRYCNTNHNTVAICTDESFWLQKLNQDFTVYTDTGKLVPGIMLHEYGYDTESWRSIYERWYNMKFQPDEYAIQYDDIMIYRIKQGMYNTDNVQILYKLAIQHNKLFILQELYANGLKYTQSFFNDTDFISIANLFKNIIIPVVSWMNTYMIMDYDIELMIALILDRQDILLWLENQEFFPATYVIDDIRNKIQQRILNFQILNKLYTLALQNNSIDFLNMIYHTDVDVYVNLAACISTISVSTLQWLREHESFLTRNYAEIIRLAIEYSRPDILEWATQYNQSSIPQLKGLVGYIIEHDSVQSLEWLESKLGTLNISLREIMAALTNQHTKILQWMINHIPMNQQYIDYATKFGSLPALQLLVKYGFVPSQRAIHNIIDEREPKLQFLATYGIYPDPNV